MEAEMKSYFILSILIMITPIFSYANIISLGSPKNIEDFKKHLKDNPQKESLIDSLITKRIETGDKEISSKYGLAVKGLLIEDLSPSIYLFKEIADFKTLLLFSKAGKDFIAESHYRLSNLERLKLNFWIKEAILFDSLHSPSSKIFNPQIIESFNLRKAELQNYFYLFDTKKIKDKNTHLFINGNLVDNSISLHPSSSYNLKLFKDGHKELSLNLDGKDISKTKKNKLQKLNFGTCNKPNFKRYKGVRVDEIFFSKNCIKKSSEQPLLAKAPSPIKTIDLATPAPIKKKKWLQKKSVWYIALGFLVATAATIAVRNQNKDVTIEPVHH